MNKGTNATLSKHVHIIYFLACVFACGLIACITQKEEASSDYVIEYVPLSLDQADEYMNAKMHGDSLHVIWRSIKEHKPEWVRLYNRAGDLVYTEKDPALDLGKRWNVDISDYVQDKQYQLFVQLDNGTEIQTWVNRE
ncbi:MAG: hypothetical protein AAF587_23575 [Bacteroidota bacterium]